MASEQADGETRTSSDLLSPLQNVLDPTPPQLFSGSGRSITAVKVVEPVVLQMSEKEDGTVISKLE